MLAALIWLGQRMVLGTVSVLSLAWIYKELTMGICRSKKRLDGKVAIVTGLPILIKKAHMLNYQHIRWQHWDWL